MTATATQRKVLRVLHVGVANRGEWPLRLCNASTGFAPAALCDVSEDALATARRTTGLDKSACFTDFDRALAEADADCAIVCAPTVHHVPLALKCIERGLPMLVEKGMAANWNDACTLVRAAHHGAGRVRLLHRLRPRAGRIVRRLRHYLRAHRPARAACAEMHRARLARAGREGHGP